ncbi:MAG: hypothetical protein IBX40_01610 [Methanosarcinales archaeon]|nr:hypothetical protein [Methanosarcinales archaeon]
MEWFSDIHHRLIRFTSERQVHIETDHPEMDRQFNKIKEICYGKISENLV